MAGLLCLKTVGEKREVCGSKGTVTYSLEQIETDIDEEEILAKMPFVIGLQTASISAKQAMCALIPLMIDRLLLINRLLG